MKVSTSNVRMDSYHYSLKFSSIQESFRAWFGNQQQPDNGTSSLQSASQPSLQTNATEAQKPAPDSYIRWPLQDLPKPAQQKPSPAKPDSFTQSETLQQILGPFQKQAQRAAIAPPVDKTTRTDELDGIDPKLKILILLLEKLTGMKFNISSPKDLQAAQDNMNESQAQLEAAKNNAAQQTAQVQQKTQAQPADQAQPAQQAQYGIEYTRQVTVYESEQTNFAAQGSIQTADGKQVNFNLKLQMSREFISRNEISFSAGAAALKDPLVVNFDGKASELSDTKFQFDLNNDGKAENIHFVKPGSGFLAIDHNSDGKINNGSELFGTKTGNGFAELAALDSDKNDWIDEADPAYNQLKVWTKTSTGEDRLQSLKQKNIGALYLKNVATPFDHKTSANGLKGQSLSSSLYLNDNGMAGLLQQLNLAV